MHRDNKDLLSQKLREMWKLLQPKQGEPCESFVIGGMLICNPLLSDGQLRQGQHILDDCMSPASGKIEDFVDAILRRLKYKLWQFDIMEREKQQLHRDIYRYRKRLGEDNPNSDKD